MEEDIKEGGGRRRGERREGRGGREKEIERMGNPFKEVVVVVGRK